MRLGERVVGPGHPVFVVAEVANSHEGSLGMAHAFVEAVAKAGADAVKFQTHIADAESTACEPWRVRFSAEDETRLDYWRRMEFSEEQWRGLKKHASERGLLFLSSPFSIDAVEMLERVGVPGWKIASGEVSNTPMLERILDTKLPIMLSTGMSPIAELDEVVARIKSREIPFAVLQCTSVYPTPPEKVGLNMIPLFRARYGCPVGLSDHSGTISSGLAAVALGAAILEVHVTLSREMFGPDVAASVTTDEVAQLVRGVRFIEKVLANPVDKDALSAELADIRRIFTKSVVARRELRAGAILGRDDLAAKKPGTGIPAARLNEVVGRRLRRPVASGEVLQEQDVEQTVEGGRRVEKEPEGQHPPRGD